MFITELLNLVRAVVPALGDISATVKKLSGDADTQAKLKDGIAGLRKLADDVEAGLQG